MTLRIDSRILHLSYPSAGQYVEASLDGADVALQGPHSLEGMTYSVRLAGRRELHILTKRNGKALHQGCLELSDESGCVKL